jgi:hypothetical protein
VGEILKSFRIVDANEDGNIKRKNEHKTFLVINVQHGITKNG